jgi:hypothetical protein
MCHCNVICLYWAILTLGDKGNLAYNSKGNIHFHEIIEITLVSYMKLTSNFDKTFMIGSVVQKVKDKGGRFLMSDPTTGQDVEITDDKAHAKVSGALQKLAKPSGEKVTKAVPTTPSSQSPPLGNFDVLCDKGKVAYNSKGNIHFREIINQSVAGLMKSTKNKRGRFLKSDPMTGQYAEQMDEKTKKKVGNCLCLLARSKKVTKAKKANVKVGNSMQSVASAIPVLELDHEPLKQKHSIDASLPPLQSLWEDRVFQTDPEYVDNRNTGRIKVTTLGTFQGRQLQEGTIGCGTNGCSVISAKCMADHLNMSYLNMTINMIVEVIDATCGPILQEICHKHKLNQCSFICLNNIYTYSFHDENLHLLNHMHIRGTGPVSGNAIIRFTTVFFLIY